MRRLPKSPGELRGRTTVWLAGPACEAVYLLMRRFGVASVSAILRACARFAAEAVEGRPELAERLKQLLAEEVS